METSLYNPNLKKGDNANVANYRPISLLCMIPKILEHLVFLSNSFYYLSYTLTCNPTSLLILYTHISGKHLTTFLMTNFFPSCGPLVWLVPYGDG